MHSIREVATVTSKGQITLPKSIRQALGVGFGGKVSFSLRGDEVVVTRSEEDAHEDPAIARFLTFLERDIEAGRNVRSLPETLGASMVATLDRSVDEDIQGDVEL